jgi:thiol-disulfide isomerase/thioredoxin
MKDKKFKESADFLKKYLQQLDPSFLPYIAKQYLKEKKEVETALEFCKLAVEKSRKDMTSMDKKPAFYTEKQWKEMKKTSLASNLAGLAEVYSVLGNKEEALKNYEEALPSLTGDNGDPIINEKYVKLLAETNQGDKAAKLIEGYIADGMCTAEMKTTAKDIYIKKNGSEAGYEKYIGKFEKIGKEKLVAKYKKEMINEPAPQFTLTDLEGKKVSLADLKGKIVIVDFWATWCGPCIGSFPGMQKALNIWKDKGVEFLFVNTWENAPEASKDDVNWKKKNASDFIKKNNYTFRVLMDEESKVVADFKVSGIPTKFILDKNGKIRFKVVGSDGIDDKTVSEISTMIELLK